MSEELLMTLCLGKTPTQEQIEDALYDMCDREHSSCNSCCYVYALNGGKPPGNDKPFKILRGCDCFKNGKAMLEFIRMKKGMSSPSYPVWNHKHFRNLLKNFKCVVNDLEPGSAWDLKGFLVRPRPHSDAISIRPFADPSSPGANEQRDNQETHAVELRTVGSCQGGLQSEDTEVQQLFLTVLNLLKNLGFRVISEYHEIF